MNLKLAGKCCNVDMKIKILEALLDGDVTREKVCAQDTETKMMDKAVSAAAAVRFAVTDHTLFLSGKHTFHLLCIREGKRL